MKGGFEVSLVILFGMTFILIAMSFVKVMADYHQARLFQESIVSQIESSHRYDEQVQTKIDDMKLCEFCHYSINQEVSKRYRVMVFFPIRIGILKFDSFVKIQSMTTPVN